ncbi:cytochrome c peroxidase [Bradyrhizobium sp. SZCCHNRI1029]|uniref:cytochrome c peroxidase n=1 Tax=Bradyrhizobium sp. SZCCHNRI1029 TaxID=3057278 RepID=UPI002916CB0C|nr:cytochrome c peroxidase [Bradyrhizobium sp. SZCCHNRI1029]
MLPFALFSTPASAQYAVPPGLPPVPVPATNPPTPAKLALGERLFFEPGLSADHSVSCASCHAPNRFFSDDKPFSRGVSGYLGARNAPSLLNAAYASHLMWDGRATTLEDQIRYPLMHPREMRNTPTRAVEYLKADPSYRAMFRNAYGDEDIIWDKVEKAIASYERTLLSGNSAFDRFAAGERTALSASAERGFDLFSGTAGCSGCHSYSTERPFFSDFEFHNTGLGWATSPDLGRYEISKERQDKGAFRTPMLRNVARTGPYMHDGRFERLSDVVEFYSRGGEQNPFLDARMRPLGLSETDKQDLVAFLESLTDQSRDVAPAAVGTAAPQDGQPRPQMHMPKVYAPFERVEIVAGGGSGSEQRKAIDSSFVGIGGIALDARRNVYVTDTGANRIRRLDASSGVIDTVAGNGFLYATSGRQAIDLAVRGPVAIAADPTGERLFFAEIIGRRVGELDLKSGRIVDLPAPRGGFGEPTGIAWSPDGLLVADAARGQIWRLSADRSWSGLLTDPQRLRGGIRSLALDSKGRVYVSEYFAHRVLCWDPASGELELVAGTGEAGRIADGALAVKSPLREPDGIALDRDDNLFIADKSNHRVVKVDADGQRLSTVIEAVQGGVDERWTPGPIAIDADGALWFGDIHRNRLLRAAPGSAPVVMAGAGALKDHELPQDAQLAHPGAVVSDRDGNVYLSDTLHHRVRVVERETGRIRTVAGTGISGYNGDGMPATESWLGYPGKLAIDSQGRLYIGDYYNNRVRRIDFRTGFITTVAGVGRAGEDGDGGPARQATLLNPHALAFEGRRLIIASAVSPKIRVVDLGDGRIDALPVQHDVSQTLVFYGVTPWKDGLVLASPRPGSVVFLKDGEITPLFAQPDVVFPQDVAVSPDGTLYICETGRNRIMRWTGSKLQVVADELGRPRSIGFDPQGNLLVADTFHNRVLRLVRETAAPSTSPSPR